MGRPLNDPPKQRIKELEQALANALAQVKAHQTLVEITEQQEGISILKKDGTQLSSTRVERKRYRLSHFAADLGLANRRISNGSRPPSKPSRSQGPFFIRFSCTANSYLALARAKLHYMLIQDGYCIGRDALFDLLRSQGMLVKRKRSYVKTTDSRGWMRQYPDLAKGLVPSVPEELWVADIT
ncbi:hypothetical protein [Spirosoma sp. KUDC1026]|uniref:hypothetical protein n=1 Tax=Spirosoma sp. KUDC1026 TaxID=2745947 RepID=UPI00159BCA65|nr:hypothetical protein [Spirosoma sp. KUDC1026]QKZ12727.1 hypothetical protein HU175_08810 [Spirosoma sp. KUDC1026]